VNANRAELADVSAELQRTRGLCWDALNQRDKARRERDELKAKHDRLQSEAMTTFGICEQLRQIRAQLEYRIDQQRRELARLNRLIADQRAAMAADGIHFFEAERWAAAVRERDVLAAENVQVSAEVRSLVASLDATRAEVARLLPLALAVGARSADDVPESVYRAYKEPEGYRADEIHRLREELAEAEGRVFNLERQIRYLTKGTDHESTAGDRRGADDDRCSRDGNT
jgi:chromosome segregation ATPase